MDCEKMKSYFHGIVSLREENGEWLPLRLTERQLERYRGIPHCPFSYATAGICMKFKTDARAFSLTYRTGSVWEWWENGKAYFDVYENGMLLDFIPVEGGEDAHVLEIARKSEDAESEIAIYFPHNAEIRICSVDFGNAEPIPESERRFLILGDSISQGLMGNSASFCYTAQLARFYDAELLNQSVGGECFDEAAIDPELPYKPTDVIVALGTNDAVFVADYERVVLNMVRHLDRVCELYGACRLFAITPPYLMNAETDGAKQYALQCRIGEAFGREARKRGFQVVCGERAVPHHKRFFSDVAHPNDFGFSQYVLYLIHEMERGH